MAVRPCNADLARLQRLAQAVEHHTLKFRQLIEKQHPQMREAHLPRLHP